MQCYVLLIKCYLIVSARVDSNVQYVPILIVSMKVSFFKYLLHSSLQSSLKVLWILILNESDAKIQL